MAHIREVAPQPYLPFSEGALRALEQAEAEPRFHRSNAINPDHVLAGILATDDDINERLKRVLPLTFVRSAIANIQGHDLYILAPEPTPTTRLVLQEGESVAREEGAGQINSIHIIKGMLRLQEPAPQEGRTVSYALTQAGLTEAQILPLLTDQPTS